MQVVKPIDIEDALRIDLAALVDGFRFFAPPIPPTLRAGDVLITPLGDGRISAASNSYDVSVGVYAEDEESARQAANVVSGYVASLPLRETSTQYSNANVTNGPYMDNDPRAPQLARYSFRASVICPGERFNF